jgi:adenylate kinase
LFLSFSSRGELVPDDVTISIWKENTKAQEVLSLYKPDDDLLVLDGIPRSVNQARLMDQYIDVLSIIHLVCDDEAKMFERLRKRALKENRFDDAREDVIRRRWRVYMDETKPVLEHYDQTVIRRVNALGSPAEVLQQILNIVVPVQSKHYHKAM